MKLNNSIEVDHFLDAVRQCDHDVWLETSDGDRLNLKSKLSQYVAVGALIKNERNLELFCADHNEERFFYNFFAKHPDAL